MAIKIKTAEQIELMRQGGRILASILEELKSEVKPGRTSRFLAQLAARRLKAQGAESAFLGYQGYPDVLCVSVNDEIVHGIPNNRLFQTGDVVSLDVGVNYRGVITDSSWTVSIGPAKADVARLLSATEQALWAGIKQARTGNRVGDISAAVETVLRQHKLGIIRAFVGHGVGLSLHEPPEVPNFGSAGKGPLLRAGMTLAIEPMATLGREDVQMEDDGWTMRTQDGSLAALFEHTVLVTEAKPEVLTKL